MSNPFKSSPPQWSENTPPCLHRSWTLSKHTLTLASPSAGQICPLSSNNKTLSHSSRATNSKRFSLVMPVLWPSWSFIALKIMDFQKPHNRGLNLHFTKERKSYIKYFLQSHKTYSSQRWDLNVGLLIFSSYCFWDHLQSLLPQNPQYWPALEGRHSWCPWSFHRKQLLLWLCGHQFKCRSRVNARGLAFVTGCSKASIKLSTKGLQRGDQLPILNFISSFPSQSSPDVQGKGIAYTMILRHKSVVADTASLWPKSTYKSSMKYSVKQTQPKTEYDCMMFTHCFKTSFNYKAKMHLWK